MVSFTDREGTKDSIVDVVVVGGGNAALCAAITARTGGMRVLLLEAAPKHHRGGNSHFTGGGVRFPHDGLDDLLSLMPELEPEAAQIDVPAYTTEMYYDDLGQDTNYLSDPDTLALLIEGSRSAVEFLKDNGLKFTWSLGRHAFKKDGRFRFPPGLVVNIAGAGAGLIDCLFDAAESLGVEIAYETRLVSLVTNDGGGIAGLQCEKADGSLITIDTGRIILASGGFESNPALRAQFLGPNWDLARVRGTSYNMGTGLTAALSVGAEAFGHYSGCHAVQSDANLPWSGEHSVGDLFARHSYPFGILVNKHSVRFLDEGADFQPHTYAKYGREVLRQDDAIAYQIFDAESVSLVRAEYHHRRATHHMADTITELAEQLEINGPQLERTVADFNNGLIPGVLFDPNVLDGKGTVDVTPPKSNWALPIATPPFHAFPVTTGITFTFGGLHVDEGARVLRANGHPIRGLYAAGEIVGGLYFHNYPSGTGLMAGTVFGRLAGASCLSDK
jgi:tricarballylate dehydrogenase